MESNRFPRRSSTRGLANFLNLASSAGTEKVERPLIHFRSSAAPRTNQTCGGRDFDLTSRTTIPLSSNLFSSFSPFHCHTRFPPLVFSMVCLYRNCRPSNSKPTSVNWNGKGNNVLRNSSRRLVLKLFDGTAHMAGLYDKYYTWAISCRHAIRGCIGRAANRPANTFLPRTRRGVPGCYADLESLCR